MPPPAAPAGLTTTPGNKQVSLSWTPGTGPTGTYSVFRGTAAGGEGSTAIASGIAGIHYIDAAVTNLTTYFYTVTANNSVGASAPSNEASAVPGASIVGTPVYQINAGN